MTALGKGLDGNPNPVMHHLPLPKNYRDLLLRGSGSGLSSLGLPVANTSYGQTLIETGYCRMHPLQNQFCTRKTHGKLTRNRQFKGYFSSTERLIEVLDRFNDAVNQTLLHDEGSPDISKDLSRVIFRHIFLCLDARCIAAAAPSVFSPASNEEFSWTRPLRV